MFCSHCGKQIPDNASFCPECGNKINSEQTEQKQSESNTGVHVLKEGKPVSWLKVIGPLLIIVVIVVGACLVISKGQKNQNPPLESKLDFEKSAFADKVDLEDYIDKDVGEMEKIGFTCQDDMTYENENGTAWVSEIDGEISNLTMLKGCQELFHNVSVGDASERAKEKMTDTYDIISVTEENLTFGLRTEQRIVIMKLRDSKVMGITILNGFDFSEYETEEIEIPIQTTDDMGKQSEEQDYTQLTGWGGAYKDNETGMRIVIAAIGYEWSYVIYSGDGTIFDSKSGCGMSDEYGGYIEGNYFIERTVTGALRMSSGLGEPWGNFTRISGTATPDAEIEGTYTDGKTTIIVTDQMADCGDENIPGGSDIAVVHIEYNNGLEIEARLYTQQDHSLAVVGNISNDIRGIITFEDRKAKITGSDFDGTYELTKE